jgi:hypothetical protein
MSAIGSNFLNNFESVKDAKKNFADVYFNNHPHRLPVLRVTGLVDIERDGRETAGTALDALKYVYAIDLSELPEWTRIYNENLPIIGTGDDPFSPNDSAGAGEFYYLSYQQVPWRDSFYLGDGLDQVKVGERTSTNYERDTITDPWVQVGSDQVYDIYASFYPLGVFYKNGGDPVSGGRGLDNDENSVGWNITIDSNDSFPFRAFLGTVVYRLPWEDPWENESALYAAAMSDWIAEQNADDGGGWTGSTTMTLEFS